MVLFALCCSMFSVEQADANEALKRRILVSGTFQMYMPAAFEVPWGNCGNLKVYEFQKSYPFFGVKGSWQLRQGGTIVPRGWYLFENTETTCSQVVEVNVQDSWFNRFDGFMEIEPEDVGLFAKGVIEPKNVFGLSEDDRQFSYELVMSGQGTMRVLDSFRANTSSFSDTGKGIVGAIVADQRGFLKRIVMFDEPSSSFTLPEDLPKGISQNPWVKKLIEQAKSLEQPGAEDIIIGDTDVVVLIRKENF